MRAVAQAVARSYIVVQVIFTYKYDPFTIKNLIRSKNMGTIKMKDKNAETVENSAPELIEKAQELAVADESTVRQTVMQDDQIGRASCRERVWYLV